MIYINDTAIICALGDQPDLVRQRLLRGESPGMQESTEWRIHSKPVFTGQVMSSLTPLPEQYARQECRNNRLLLAASLKVDESIRSAIDRYGEDRVGVVLGTSTSGISSGEEALLYFKEHGSFPDSYDYFQQELGGPSEFLATYYHLKGPAYTLSTACSSSAKAFMSARSLLDADLCDAVIVGGVDTLCRLTVNGFDGLESLSQSVCNPLSLNRDGINIGEGAALFVMSKELGKVAFLGGGESSDAYHVSAPDPEGQGAAEAIRLALEQAGLSPEDIGYVNLHGTATKLNDVMEAKAVRTVLGPDKLCSSTKPLTGHTLGAAGAIEAALCWLILTQEGDMHVPPQVWDGVEDPEITGVRIAGPGDQLLTPCCLSNSFAFGGNNVSLVFGRTDD